MNFVDFGGIIPYLFLLIFFAFILYECFQYIKNVKLKYPPGPKGLPFVGFLPYLGRKPYETLRNLSTTYGNIISLKLGDKSVVVLNDYAAVKEAFSNPHILDRPSGVFDFQAAGLGVTGASGDKWFEERRFISKILKDIGVGRDRWEKALDNEIDDFLETLLSHNGQPVDIQDELTANLTNNSLSLVLGKTLSKDDPDLRVVIKAVDAISPVLNQSSAANFAPAVAWALSKLGLSKVGKEIKRLENLNKFFKKEVEKRKQNQSGGETTFIDEYLKKIKDLKGTNAACEFSEYDLIGSAQSLIHGGTETVRTSLLWLFLAMAAYPDIQRRVHAEIVDHLGTSNRCTWSDRKLLPYTYATVMEGQRWRTGLPLGFAHLVSADTEIGGYCIPKGTFVISNLWAVHNDPRYWTDPEKFIPDRFLSEDQSLKTRAPEGYVPFSYGRRICPGELIAYVELFRFFTATIQKFEIRSTHENSPNLQEIVGATNHPCPQTLIFVPRY